MYFKQCIKTNTTYYITGLQNGHRDGRLVEMGSGQKDKFSNLRNVSGHFRKENTLQLRNCL